MLLHEELWRDTECTVANPGVIVRIAKARFEPITGTANYVIDAASAKALREYVSNGGTVLMTAYSAKVDEHGQWFDTPLPGRLSDVFGLKTNAFYRVEPTFTVAG